MDKYNILVKELVLVVLILLHSNRAADAASDLSPSVYKYPLSNVRASLGQIEPSC